jgi:glutathione S-transferase
MALELVSFPLCPYVHRSTILLLEKRADFQVVYVDLNDKPDWFLAISPRSKVPVLVVDSVPIFESAVINEYLDETVPPRLLPADPLERARQRAWIEVANDLFERQYDVVYAPTRDAFDAGRPKLAAVLERLEEAVRAPYFAGASLGLVDVALAPALFRCSVLEACSSVRFLEEFPKLRGLTELLCARPSVRKGAPEGFAEKYVARMRGRASYLGRELVATR